MSGAPATGALGAGITLLEASAGTGKTFRIIHTILRLVADEGVPIGRIVVVTFTIAATAELRDRVRKRLRDALGGLRAVAAGDAPGGTDEVLAAWIPHAPPEAIERLERALIDFDEAAITTIHGFCNRALARHAFESGASFGDELVGDAAAVLGDFVTDFRTKLVIDAPRDLLPALEYGGIDQDTLLDLAEKVFDPDRPVLPSAPLDAPIPDLRAWRATWATARQAWRKHGRAVVELLLKSDAIYGRAGKGHDSFPGVRTSNMAKAMDRLCKEAPPAAAPVPEAILYFTPAHVLEATKEGMTPPSHPVFDALEAYAAEHARVQPAMVAWTLSIKLRLVEAVRTEVPRLLRKLSVRTYDQMLRLLRDALADERRSEALVAGLRSDFDVALIDEFQDTDAVQWQIFHTVFPDRLCLIGDPKQAIYGFRGADVFTYRRAAKLRDHQDTLGENFRSDPLLVEAINHLFGREEVRRPFGTDEIPFVPVEPHHQQARLESDERPPLELRFMPRRGARTYQSHIASYFMDGNLPGVVANDIVEELLRSGTLRGDDGHARTVSPGDCAVLVRSHKQARLIREALRARGVPSVLRTDRSVFETDEANQLATILDAVLEPTTGHIRVALATPLLGYSGSRIAHLETDEVAWSEVRRRFRRWYERWMTDGVALMLRDVVDTEGVATRVLLRGEARALTNVMQLAELLHETAMRQRLGPVGLISWLRREGPGADDEAKALRLQSDDDAVQVVTMHSCKGLEYPLVWCPYLWQSGFLSEMDVTHTRFHDPEDDYAAKLDIGSGDRPAHIELARQEQLEEDLRLLYVALTRARHRCVVYHGTGAFSSALAYILHQALKDPIDALAEKAFGRLRKDERMLKDLEALAQHPGIALSKIDWSAAEGPRWSAGVAPAPLVCRALTRELAPDTWWRRTSYSGLVRGASHFDPEEHRDVDAEDDEPETPVEVGEIPLHDLPGGARVGHLFHRILELHDFEDDAALAPLVAHELGARGFDPSLEPRITTAIQSALSTAVLDDGFCIGELTRAQRLDELGFVLPLRGGFADPGKSFSVSQLVDVFDAPDAPAGYAKRLKELAFLPARGFLVGAIDLVFEHGGKYWVADYKSNKLGAAWRDYEGAALTRQMAVANYYLQYHLYTVAVHRYLAQRIADYDYDTHFGGALYLFLRGMAPDRGPACGVFADRPARSLIERLDRALAEGGIVTTLGELRDAGVLDGLDVRFAEALGRLGEASDPVLVAAALANRAPRVGDVGVDLERIGAMLAGELDAEIELPEADAWIAALSQAGDLVRQAGDAARTPLVRDGLMLYLDRYFRYQERLAAALRERAATERVDFDPALLESSLAPLFTDDAETALQRKAAETAVRRSLTLVSGGPGTGKTAVVVKVLALLVQQAQHRGDAAPRVAMVAPTGKAAARLTESIRRTKELWIPEPLRADIPEDASTIHRRLGTVWKTPRFKHDAESPLPADVVIVDEASMVDLPLMARLVDAVAPQARLILLGDPDQLVSVELGAVLANLCEAPALAACHVHLEHTWRYPPYSGIAKLARAVNEGNADAALQVLADASDPDVERLDAADHAALEQTLRPLVLDRYRPYLEAKTPEAALEALTRFRLLSAHRRGLRGVERLNFQIETWLAEEDLIQPSREWYTGRPIMVTRNDRDLGLYNGDVGVILPEGDHQRAWFPAPGGGVRSFSPSVIPEHETVFATTVHKAQGSEYEEVLLVLPSEASRVLTRELLYTAATRATKRVAIVGGEGVMSQGVARHVERMSGLDKALAPSSSPDGNLRSTDEKSGTD